MKITLRRLLYAAQWSWLMFLLYALVGKNLITMLRGMLMIVCATWFGIFLNKSCGIENWIAIPVAFFIVYFFSWAFLLGRILLFYPFPLCRKGKCQSIDDYSWFHGSFFGKWAGVYWYSCRCGDQYLRRGKRFMEFIPEAAVPPSPWINLNKGSTRPYKKLVGFRKWADDTEI